MLTMIARGSLRWASAIQKLEQGRVLDVHRPCRRVFPPLYLKHLSFAFVLCSQTDSVIQRIFKRTHTIRMYRTKPIHISSIMALFATLVQQTLWPQSAEAIRFD